MQLRRLFLAAILGIFSIYTHAETTPSSGSTIRIKKITPSISEELKPGAKITIVVELHYNLAAKSGRAGLVIQRASSNGSPLATEFVKVVQGAGDTKIQAQITVPKTTSLQIFTPLYHDGGEATSVVDSRVFEVAVQ
jgi:hypothetical protein